MNDLGLSDFTGVCDTSQCLCAGEAETGPEQIQP